tara:strand:+ start:1118 stop:1639 length:522 start_codon:yes stop_codon:yes gene_type:complete
MKIAIGTQNPAKIKAVEQAISKIWPGAEIIPVNVSSGISEMPSSDQESIIGAKTRANNALELVKADLGIGLEGNCHETDHGTLLTGWVAAVDKEGKQGLGCSGGTILPEKIAVEVRKGRELGPLMDEVIGEPNVKQKGGAIGFLTKDHVSRTAAFERGVVFALTRFIREDVYE